MRTRLIQFRSILPASADEAFGWHERPGAFERLNPPWDPARVLRRVGGIRPGGELGLSVKALGPIRVRWIASHRDYAPGRLFRDVQTRGPFAAFDHRHIFEPVHAGACVMHEHIELAAPGGAIGDRLIGASIARTLARVFAYRHRTLRGDLAAHAETPEGVVRGVAVTGASGLVGRALCAFLSTGGWRVERLVRAGGRARTDADPDQWPARVWDPASGAVERGDPLSLPSAVVHLAGAGVADRRWTRAYREVIRSSRVDATRALCEGLARLPAARRPGVMVCASAIGFYDKGLGDSVLDESGPSGDGFLAEVCRAWEGATRAATEAGIRVVNLRLGVVLSPGGGALGALLPLARAGLLGPMGTGRQWMSWISLDDALGAILRALWDARLRGPVNAVAPQPVRQAEFARALGRAIGRPACVPAPAWALRAALCEFADAELLAGCRVVPGALADVGHRFRHRYVDDALRHVLGVSPSFDA